MIEYACDDCIFHFNKKHLEDDTIPMWILKLKGSSYYVNHVDCRTGWSTKESPDSNHTKGSIKIKNCLVVIDDDNCAIITELTDTDKIRLRNKEKGITRIIIYNNTKVTSVLSNNKIKHAPIKKVYGSCGTVFYVTDILDKKHMTMLSLSLSNTDYRILTENEGYYKAYDDPGHTYNFDEDYDYEDEDEDEE